MEILHGPGEAAAVGQVFAVDEVAEAADALAKDHAGSGCIEADGDGPLVVERVEQPAQDATKEATVEGDAAFGDAGDDLQRLAGEAVPVLEHVEEARADDSRRHADEGDLLGDLGRDTVLLRNPDGEGHASDDADGGEEPVPGEGEGPEVEHDRVDIDVDREEGKQGEATHRE